MKLNQYLKSVLDESEWTEAAPKITREKLISIKDDLLSLEEFRNVEKINVLDKSSSTLTYKFAPKLKFAKVVNLWEICFSPPLYDKDSTSDLPSGVWLLPPVATSHFEIMKEIRIRWSPDLRQDLEALDPAAEQRQRGKIMNEVEQMLSGSRNTTNIPHKRSILLRMTSDSVEDRLRADNDCYVNFTNNENNRSKSFSRKT